ncbi:valine--tRNA ligase, mitochondrial-like [Rhea pennata]|uniref:valine--tRNA ligase, mitochondrial-like n=1 Tax=Rhea pennata TaxID=8795 RepID=UPI002E2772ED
MPYVTEELWQRLPRAGPTAAPSLCLAEFPSGERLARWLCPRVEADVAVLQDVVRAVRGLRDAFGLGAARPPGAAGAGGRAEPPAEPPAPPRGPGAENTLKAAENTPNRQKRPGTGRKHPESGRKQPQTSKNTPERAENALKAAENTLERAENALKAAETPRNGQKTP